MVGRFLICIVAEDGISMEKRAGHFEGLNGDYRSMLSKPDHMGWSFIRYNDPTEKLCNTDIDRIENVAEPVGVEGNQKNIPCVLDMCIFKSLSLRYRWRVFSFEG